MAASTLSISLRGQELLLHPAYNKGSAFTEGEREAFDLIGLLPPKCDTLTQQQERAYEQYSSQGSDLAKNTFLQSIKAQNWILFYSLIQAHLEEMFPIIYTPTEAQAISQFSHLFRRPEGLWLSPFSLSTMESSFLSSLSTLGKDIDLVIVSDGEAILGIGDQGSGAMGISTAKGTIYTLVAGVDPGRVLPVALDVGTDNEKLLKDDMYLGWPKKRLRGKAYDSFLEQFVGLVKKYCPRALLHFEDFGVSNAQNLLDTYRDQHPIFNDDVQGTGAVTLAAIQAALHITKSKLSQQRIVSFGAGSAGLGIARQLRDAAVLIDGVTQEEANKMIYLVDKNGLLKKGISDKIRKGIDSEFVREDSDVDGVGNWPEGENGLLEIVKRVKPTILIGTSTSAGAFTEDIIKAMAEGTERPIILPLSNPTELCEVKPQDAMTWTDGKALIATGSPFPPVSKPNSSEKYIVAECNNALIYPGLGFGAIVSGASKVTDKMIVKGCLSLAGLSPALEDVQGSLLPDFADAQAVNLEIAIAVVEQAIEEGVARVEIPRDKVGRYVKDKMWRAEYAEYVYDDDGYPKK